MDGWIGGGVFGFIDGVERSLGRRILNFCCHHLLSSFFFILHSASASSSSSSSSSSFCQPTKTINYITHCQTFI